jgi:hypothetical protein
MSSPAYAVFERLEHQVQMIRQAAARDLAAGHLDAAPPILRSCIVLTVAALDTYMHEQGVRLLGLRAHVGPAEATSVAGYLGGVNAADITGPSAQGRIRLRLSYKTLVAPDKIDALFTAVGERPDDIWLEAALALGTRPDRLRLQTQLQYDRRNQIAHEGDWDSVNLDFHPLADAHVNDCISWVSKLVHQFDALLS